MKRKLTIALVFVLIFSASILGFAGCASGKHKATEVEYKVTEEEWDNATSLYWKNLTFEHTYMDEGQAKTQKIELLADGSMHQSGDGWGEKYVAYRDSKWIVYNASGEQSFEYDTASDYIAGNYGDDIGFMKGILPLFEGKMGEFTYDEAKHQYVAENYYFIVYGNEGYYANIVVKFEDANLVYIKVSFVENEGAGFEVNLYDYGKTTIDFPASIPQA